VLFLRKDCMQKDMKLIFFVPKDLLFIRKELKVPFIQSRISMETNTINLCLKSRDELLQPFNTELHLILLENLIKNSYDLVHFHTAPMFFPWLSQEELISPKFLLFITNFQNLTTKFWICTLKTITIILFPSVWHKGNQ